MIVFFLGWLFVALGFAGALYAVLAMRFVARFAAEPQLSLRDLPPVTLLKPLHGAEPGLAENLASFLTQDYPAPVQIVFGVHSTEDGAVTVVEQLKALYPAADITLIADTARHGANPKIANLLNMLGAARHDTLVISDSDIAVEPDYLKRVVSALSPKTTGAVTCLYTGRPLRGLVSHLSAMGVSYQFLPNVMAGLGFGLATPCFGSTIAIKRAVLTEIGGLEAFADILADDNAIGQAVRKAGYTLAIPPFAVRHTATEAGWGPLFTHELRWMRTIRTVDPAGHFGSIVTHAFPLSLLGLMLTGGALPAGVALAVAFLARIGIKKNIDAAFGAPAGPLWLLPLRDVLSFAVFLASLFGGAVIWQEAKLSVRKDGVLSGN